MKKTVLAAAAVVLAVLALLAGCGKERKTPTVRIGVALYQQEDTFLATVVQNLEQLARAEEQARGIKINLNVTDARGSQSAQNEQVDTFLQQGCDMICVNLVDRTAAAVIVDKAQAAGVPLIFFNREPVEKDNGNIRLHSLIDHAGRGGTVHHIDAEHVAAKIDHTLRLAVLRELISLRVPDIQRHADPGLLFIFLRRLLHGIPERADERVIPAV